MNLSTDQSWSPNWPNNHILYCSFDRPTVRWLTDQWPTYRTVNQFILTDRSIPWSVKINHLDWPIDTTVGQDKSIDRSTIDEFINDQDWLTDRLDLPIDQWSTNRLDNRICIIFERRPTNLDWPTLIDQPSVQSINLSFGRFVDQGCLTDRPTDRTIVFISFVRPIDLDRPTCRAVPSINLSRLTNR